MQASKTYLLGHIQLRININYYDVYLILFYFKKETNKYTCFKCRLTLSHHLAHRTWGGKLVRCNANMAAVCHSNCAELLFRFNGSDCVICESSAAHALLLSERNYLHNNWRIQSTPEMGNNSFQTISIRCQSNDCGWGAQLPSVNTAPNSIDTFNLTGVVKATHTNMMIRLMTFNCSLMANSESKR